MSSHPEGSTTHATSLVMTSCLCRGGGGCPLSCNDLLSLQGGGGGGVLSHVMTSCLCRGGGGGVLS